MNVAFLLDETNVSAVARTTLAYADALIARGIAARIITTDAAPRWRPSRAEWIYADDFESCELSAHDRVVATSPALARVAAHRAPRTAVHLCFGSEDSASLELALPKLAASRAALDALRHRWPDAALGGILVDDEVYARPGRRENAPLRVLISGASQNEHAGIEEAYGAVAHARWFHQKLDLVRVSPWAPSREEPLDSVQEFHVGLTTVELARVMHSCDIAIAAGWREQTFALSPAESVAAGLACVMTETPANTTLADSRDYALFAPERNAVELGEKLIELLNDEELRERVRDAGRKASEAWRSAVVGERLGSVFRK